MNNKVILAIFLLLMVTGLFAENHDPHEHGAVHAQIELGSTEGHIQFKLTGMDFIGFGYLAKSDEDIELVHDKIETVTESDFVKIKKRLYSTAEIHHIDVDEPGHENHEEEHDEHGGEHEEHHGEHTDYLITVEIEYSAFSKLKSFDITAFFNLFPSVEEVEWVMISDNGQNAGEATVESPVIKVN